LYECALWAHLRHPVDLLLEPPDDGG
jgi:hypothetical protein